MMIMHEIADTSTIIILISFKSIITSINTKVGLIYDLFRLSTPIMIIFIGYRTVAWYQEEIGCTITTHFLKHFKINRFAFLNRSIQSRFFFFGKNFI